MKSSNKVQLLWSVFVLGIFLLNYPVMKLYNIQSTVAGVPLLYVMVFGIWLFLIVLTYIAIRKSKKEERGA
jgi:ABC-type thiamin/hydroxymethylpyrimidine transport system permease subunit